MIREIKSPLWAFDIEWVPDPVAGRRLYGLSEQTPDIEVVGEMWKRGGATEENPTPFLKLIQCRIVSIAAVIRTARKDGAPDLKLLWLPRDPNDPTQREERAIIGRFLDGIGKNHPQLVGYNSQASDMRILIQRAVVNGIASPEFCRRPAKPWEGADYCSARESDWHLDLMQLLCGWSRADGKSYAMLHEAAVLSGIPGKFEGDGLGVAQLWLAGRWREIVEYNCFDALTTYLLWLRMAHFAGLFNDEAYANEQDALKDYLLSESEKPETAFLERYLDEWDRLQPS